MALADQWFRRAIDLLTEIGTPFLLARAQVAYAEFLVGNGGDSGAVAALRGEAVPALQRLEARPWLERAEALGSAVPA